MAIGWQVPANWWTRDHNLCIATSWITVARALGVDYRKVETQGPVKVMPNHHLSQTVRIGQITKDGQFAILEETDGPISPQAWNQIHPDSAGYACDWTDASKGGKYKL